MGALKARTRGQRIARKPDDAQRRTKTLPSLIGNTRSAPGRRVGSTGRPRRCVVQIEEKCQVRREVESGATGTCHGRKRDGRLLFAITNLSRKLASSPKRAPSGKHSHEALRRLSMHHRPGTNDRRGYAGRNGAEWQRVKSATALATENPRHSHGTRKGTKLGHEITTSRTEARNHKSWPRRHGDH